VRLVAILAGSVVLASLAARRAFASRQQAARRSTRAAIVVMGPSGSGKSTLARALAKELGAPYIEGDQHHSPANIAKLAAGVPLTEVDRQPFLESVGRAVAGAAYLPVVSCSALRRSHRAILRRHAPHMVFVWIDVPTEELERRLLHRPGHFMPASLLDDQLATFERPAPPEEFIWVDGLLPTSEQVHTIVPHLPAGGAPGRLADRATRRNRRGRTGFDIHGTGSDR